MKIKNLAHALYNKLEDENYHGFCAVINWLFNLYDVKYTTDFEGITRVLGNPRYFVRHSAPDGTYTTKRYRMIVTFEAVDVEVPKDEFASRYLS
jgi:hypothetical protein